MKRSADDLSRSDGTSESSGADATGPDIVVFNAGGTLHSTLLQTLRRSSTAFPDCVFAFLFAGEEWRLQCDRSGAYFVDRDGETFRAVLQVLRHPLLARLTPKSLTRELWQRELEFWGLVEPQLRKRAKLQPTSEDSLSELGHAIRRRVIGNEKTAVQTLLHKSGYASNGQLTRHTRLLVPVGECALAWGQDLGTFLSDEQGARATVRLLSESLAPCHVKVGLYCGSEAVQYSFDGAHYNTEQQRTVQVQIELEDDDEGQ